MRGLLLECARKLEAEVASQAQVALYTLFHTGRRNRIGNLRLRVRSCTLIAQLRFGGRCHRKLR